MVSIQEAVARRGALAKDFSRNAGLFQRLGQVQSAMAKLTEERGEGEETVEGFRKAASTRKLIAQVLAQESLRLSGDRSSHVG